MRTKIENETNDVLESEKTLRKDSNSSWPHWQQCQKKSSEL